MSPQDHKDVVATNAENECFDPSLDFQTLHDSLPSVDMKRTFEDSKADCEVPMYLNSRSDGMDRHDHTQYHQQGTRAMGASLATAEDDEADDEPPAFLDGILDFETMLSSPYLPQREEHHSFSSIDTLADHGEMRASQYEPPGFPNEPYYMPHTDWEDSADLPQPDSADDSKLPGSPDAAFAYPGPGWTSLHERAVSTSPSGLSGDTDSSDESLFIHHPACGCNCHHACACMYDWRAGAVVATMPFRNKLQQAQGDPGHMQRFRRVKQMRGDGFGNSESRLRCEW